MKLKVNRQLTLIFAILSAGAMMVNISIFYANPEIVIEKSSLRIIPATSYLIALIFHVISVFFLLQEYSKKKKQRPLVIFALLILLLSAGSFLVDKVMIDELADDIRHGFDISLEILAIPLLTKIIYAAVVIIICLGKKNKQKVIDAAC